MKLRNILLKTLFPLVAMTLSCQPDDPKPAGEAVAKAPLFEGTWVIKQALQYDLNAVSKGFPSFAQSQDITKAVDGVDYTTFKIKFNTSGGTPSTYQILAGGALFPQYSATGTWKFDSNDFPSQIILNGSIVLPINALNGLTAQAPSFTLGSTKNWKKTPDKIISVIRYDYVFAKQ